MRAVGNRRPDETAIVPGRVNTCIWIPNKSDTAHNNARHHILRPSRDNPCKGCHGCSSPAYDVVPIVWVDPSHEPVSWLRHTRRSRQHSSKTAGARLPPAGMGQDCCCQDCHHTDHALPVLLLLQAECRQQRCGRKITAGVAGAGHSLQCPSVERVLAAASSLCCSPLQKELAEVWAASKQQQAPASANSTGSLQDPTQGLDELTQQQRKTNDTRKLSTDRKLSADLSSTGGSQDKGAALWSSSIAVHKRQDQQQPSGCATDSPPCLRWLPYKVCGAAAAAAVPKEEQGVRNKPAAARSFLPFPPAQG